MRGELMEREHQRNIQYGREIIKKARLNYDEFLALFTTHKDIFGNEVYSYQEYAPDDHRERLFFLLILLAKLEHFEKERKSEDTLVSGYKWINKVVIIMDLLDTRQILDTTGINFAGAVDEAAKALYEEVKDSTDWKEWKTVFSSMSFYGIDSYLEDLREQVCKNENVKEQFRKMDQKEGKAATIRKIKDYLIKTRQLEDLRSSKKNVSELSREIAEEFDTPEKAESIRQRLINLRDGKELPDEKDPPD